MESMIVLYECIVSQQPPGDTHGLLYFMPENGGYTLIAGHKHGNPNTGEGAILFYRRNDLVPRHGVEAIFRRLKQLRWDEADIFNLPEKLACHGEVTAYRPYDIMLWRKVAISAGFFSKLEAEVLRFPPPRPLSGWQRLRALFTGHGISRAA